MIDTNSSKIIGYFFLEHNYDLLQEPIKGDLKLTFNTFLSYLSSNPFKSYDKELSYLPFLEQLHGFYQVSGKALEFNFVFDSEKQREKYRGLKVPRITWINTQKITILLDRLEGKNDKICYKVSNVVQSEKDRPNREQLWALLSQPFNTSADIELHSRSNAVTVFNTDFNTLDQILKKKTAVSQLAKKKIALKTSVKPFYDVCDNTSHSSTLANLILNKKELRNSTSDSTQVYKVIQQNRNNMSQEVYRCSHQKIHFLPIFNQNTDLSLGDCSYLDTCHKMRACRYLHYFTLQPCAAKYNYEDSLKEASKKALNHEYTIGQSFTDYQRKVLPPQWIKCDVRYLPFSILGKFAVIISDPAWDIHMSLPYGTCKDFELLSLPMHELQDEGILLLWVTGRSIEVGRQALQNWGYTVSDELIWIKLNQLKRTIVTGRTGHWLNHSKEHLLVGIKGNPPWINRFLDTDVVVSGTRETSRKPDEIYDIVERIIGLHARKLEIFGRDHNIRPGWLTIGNQLSGYDLHERELVIKYEEYLNKREGSKPLNR
ncbi:Piso0_000349 [Millerozyma farinosa CBS 7064]|uniref:mRNA m(6)A methyltransferase n=1 Tax=Pichia sorbitophila (strain ATCC MYA-4447 / BCRC 22081 / CBS 7064 / NBRC 10061 / NRRL Y-12695) TaxID=559304 RepID=G8YTR5_PICSO|nr:Piso0_000349 [Millerozyma farinosa CBS 7064]CCE73316.1 Piso0_000349 [Millerozyma farinosa CBS 7064]